MSQQINLYNPLFLKQEKHFSARTMAQALAVVCVGIAAVFVSSFLQTRSAERLAVQTREQAASQRDQLVKLGAQITPGARSKALEADVGQLEAEIKHRQAILLALTAGDLGNTSGFSEFLAALGRQTLPGVWLTRIQIRDAGNELTVEGRTLRPELLPTYLSALNREAMMRGRRVTEMKLAAAGGKPDAPAAPFVEFSFAAPLELREAAPGARSP